MALTLLLQSPSITAFNPPSSPDPTPLRMLAFSVAEAALQQDPNSPMFGLNESVLTQDVWGREAKSPSSRWSAEPKPVPSIAARRGKPLWEMVDKARERRDRERSSPSSVDSPLPTSPISPDSYHFILPSNSHLAASVAGGAAAPSKHGLILPASPTKQYPFPLYTRSAEPSPTKSTFCALDQTRPPPEFVPRLSAKEFANAPSAVVATSPSQRLKAQATSRLDLPSRTTSNGKLPSLAEIQKKMKGGHRRNGSAGSMPRATRSDSESSLEVITTPDEEINRFNLVILNERSDSPPIESRLAPFLRQRTSGRLVHAPRPLSMPPLSYDQIIDKPSFMVTPPSATPSVPPPSARVVPKSVTPVRAAFATPPSQFRFRTPSPSSPTDSAPGPARSPSPTLSIPIITCTPAQQGDNDSDSESEPDVVVFDGEVEQAKEMQERERRGQAMKNMLLSRRRSLN